MPELPPHRTLSPAEIAKLPPKPKPGAKATEWQPILDEIASGDYVAIPVETPKQLKGYRIGLARVAKARMGMTLEFRDLGHELVVFKSDDQDEEHSEETRSGTPSRQSRKKTAG